MGPTVTASMLGDRMEIRVADRGPGVPEAGLDRMFAPFEHLGSRAGTAVPAGAPLSSGAGLGLTLARGLVEAMHGTLTPEETPGGGLTMTVSLTAATAG